jgi:hypothetical protein
MEAVAVKEFVRLMEQENKHSHFKTYDSGIQISLENSSRCDYAFVEKLIAPCKMFAERAISS